MTALYFCLLGWLKARVTGLVSGTARAQGLLVAWVAVADCLLVCSAQLRVCLARGSLSDTAAFADLPVSVSACARVAVGRIEQAGQGGCSTRVYLRAGRCPGVAGDGRICYAEPALVASVRH